MVKILSFVLLAFLLNQLSWGRSKGLRQYYQENKMSKADVLLIKMIQAKLFYSAVPVLKTILVRGVHRLKPETEKAIAILVDQVGVKPFEVLPIRFLNRTSSPSIRFIVAKKYFGEKKHREALRALQAIPRRHPIFPYARNMEATIYSVENKYERAYETFLDCQRVSNNWISEVESERRKNQFMMNRDYCIVGKARVRYAQGKFDIADLLYLDLSKSSVVWPEILFDEAWTSYYQGNYNRTLGKLVNYKAPVLNYFFNPEIEVLTALSYMKLCLYGDVKKSVKDFNKTYFTDTKYFRRFLKKMNRNYKLYFNLISKYQRYGRSPNKLINRLLSNILKEHAFMDLNENYLRSLKEIDQISSIRKGAFKNFIYKNAVEVNATYKKIIGSYIRSRLISNYARLYKAFEGMSYIKLEVLAQKKAKLYSFEKEKRSRGDLKYIKRNEKQYFWNFNGEFWADELGDYVFALKSEC